MSFYLLTINKSNNSLISAKKKIRKISLFRFLIKQWRQHPGKGRYLPELPHRQHPQGHALQHACMLQQEVLFCPSQSQGEPPFAYGLSTRPIPPPNPQKPPSRPLFHPKSRHKICTKNFGNDM